MFDRRKKRYLERNIMINNVKTFMKRQIEKCFGNASDETNKTTQKKAASKPAEKKPSSG